MVMLNGIVCVCACALQLCQGLVSGPGGVDKISSVQRSLLAKRRLVQLINNRAKLLALCSCILHRTLPSTQPVGPLPTTGWGHTLSQDSRARLGARLHYVM